MKRPMVTSRWVLNHGCICSLHCAAWDCLFYGVTLLGSFLKGSMGVNTWALFLWSWLQIVGWNCCEQFQAALEIFWGWHHCSSVIVVIFVANRACYTGAHILFHLEQNTIIAAVIWGCSWFLILTNHKSMASAVHFSHLNAGWHH
jgi:hypothetical protein